MPKFHFHLVTRSDRESIGSLDLPDKDAAIPAGLKLTTQILAGAACQKAENDGWIVEVTTDTGVLVYNFKVSRQARPDNISGYVR